MDRNLTTRAGLTPALAMLALALLLGGCNIFAFPLYVLMPDLNKKKVAPEFVFPEGSKVAVAVYAGMDTLYEYPFIRQELSSAIEGEFRREVESVSLISYDQVVRYQESNVYWHTQPLVDLGKAVGADYVLYIAVNHFSTYEHGSINLPRGTMNASACLLPVNARAAIAARNAAEGRDGSDESGAAEPVATEPATRSALTKPLWDRSMISIDQDASTGPLFADQNSLRGAVLVKFAIKLTRSFHAYVLDEDEDL